MTSRDPDFVAAALRQEAQPQLRLLEKNSFLPRLICIRAMALRHVYLYMGSWPRLVEMMYWPMVNICLYGFISLSIVRSVGHTTVSTEAYLGGLVLAEVLVRTIMAMLVMFMEELWSRNLGHLFASPLRLRDFAASLMSLGIIRCLVAVTPAFLVVYFLFGFSILQLGWVLPLYVGLLCLNGCWYGLLIMALLLRFGMAAEWLGWMCAWLLMPFMAPYYPVSILPSAFQVISYSLPGTYVFESMKAQLVNGAPRMDYLAIGLGFNILYFCISIVIFKRSFGYARNNGGLLQMGE